jgi:hypothetical protein
MDNNNPFYNAEQINRVLTNPKLLQIQLNNYLWFKFPSLRKAARAAGISYERLKQIRIGYCIPQSPEQIRQIARGWDIDEIRLAQIFDVLRDSYEKKAEQNAGGETPAEPEIKTALELLNEKGDKDENNAD